GFGRDRGLRRAWIGAQAQVGTEDIAVCRALLHDVDEIAHKADEKTAGLHGFNKRCGFAVEEDNEIDVARIVQFIGTEFADAEDDQAAIALRMGGVARQEMPGFSRASKEEANGQADEKLSRLAQSACYLVHAPGAAQIGERNEKGNPAFALPQAA